MAVGASRRSSMVHGPRHPYGTDSMATAAGAGVHRRLRVRFGANRCTGRTGAVVAGGAITGSRYTLVSESRRLPQCRGMAA